MERLSWSIQGAPLSSQGPPEKEGGGSDRRRDDLSRGRCDVAMRQGTQHLRKQEKAGADSPQSQGSRRITALSALILAQ